MREVVVEKSTMTESENLELRRSKKEFFFLVGEGDVTEGRNKDAERYILKRLRLEDRIELCEVVPCGLTLEVWCDLCVGCADIVRLFWSCGEPVSVLLCGQRHPGVWWVGGWSTDLWPRVVLRYTRYLRRVLPSLLLSLGARRVEVWSQTARTDVARWIRSFGGYPETILREYGKSGRDFTLYRFLRSEWQDKG